jgi:selenocysteine lyase/cysteine desulfurase
MTPLACQKSLFSLPDGLHYLNCAYMSPATKQVEGAGIQGVQRKRVPTMVAPRDFFTESDAIRAAFAGLVGGDSARVAIIPAVSYGAATVVKNLRPRPGQTVVVAHDQFPSFVYAWQRLEELGVRLVTVAPPSDAPNRGEAWNERLLEAVTPDTLLVALPHVHWSDGTRFDLEAIGERAREVGAALVVDGTQSLGAMPFDVSGLRPDALLAAGYKTLMGPYGLGYAHYGPRFDGGDPLEESWLGRKDVEDFSRLTDYSLEYAPGAARYDVGERCNFILLPMGLAALAHLREWEPARVQAYCRQLMAGAVQELRDMGYWLEDEAWRAHHLFGVRLPAGLSMARVQESLAKHHVALSLRGDALRVSLNVYNDEEDVAALVAALREARG